MSETSRHQQILENREFLKHIESEEEFETDQQLRKPQPPLYKEARADHAVIQLPTNYRDLPISGDVLTLIETRKSDRVFKQTAMTLLELSYLLWVTQGVKEIRGKNYATIRNVPCGGARHEFETYLLIANVETLEPGAYHYLPEQHSLEYLHPEEHPAVMLDQLFCKQTWTAKGSVGFFWSIIPYRAEWRYDIYAHRIALVDIGHVGENLYLGAHSIGLGSCGIGAYDQKLVDPYFELDAQNEYILYSASVGTLK